LRQIFGGRALHVVLVEEFEIGQDGEFLAGEVVAQLLADGIVIG